MSATLSLNVAPTKAGLAEARRELDRLEDTLALEWGERIGPPTCEPEDGTDPAEMPPTTQPIVAIYERSVVHGRSRELLEVIRGGKANALTPAELGQELGPDAGGKKLSKASVRAVIRNIQKTEGYLQAEGVIKRRVMLADFDDYDTIGAGKYYVSAEDKQTLKTYLGR